jgi:hypothetical protein
MKRDLSGSRFHAGNLGVTATLASFLLLSGCDFGGGRLVSVRGKVTRAGKPVENLVVNFMPDNGRPSWGLTDENGEYEAHYDKDRNGVKPGAHTVFVTFKRYDPRDSGRLLIEPPGLVPILAKYGRVETSTIRIDAKAKNQVFDFCLD